MNGFRKSNLEAPDARKNPDGDTGPLRFVSAASMSLGLARRNRTFMPGKSGASMPGCHKKIGKMNLP
jgi:hypothetical protein